jgi:hypothetical protein
MPTLFYPRLSGLSPRRILLVLLFVAITLLLASPARSWDRLGHERAAALVFDQLGATQQQDWIDILRHHPRFESDFLAEMPNDVANRDQHAQHRWLFARAGYWPDIARGLPDAARRAFNRPNWHWIDGRWVRQDVPRQGNVYLGMPAMSDINGPGDTAIRESRLSDNVLTALVSAAAQLEQPSHQASDEELAEMAVALCWFLHLGADIHQPLHAGALYHSGHLPEGDRGGNLLRLSSRSNLHSRWDQALRGSSWAQLLATFQQLDSDDSGYAFTPGTWLRESREALHTDVYTDAVKAQIIATPANADEVRLQVNEAYFADMQSIALQRIAISAARLAQALKAIPTD